MNSCIIMVTKPNGKKKEYKSISDFHRESGYSFDTIRKAVRENKPMKDGTRVRKYNPYKIIGFSGKESRKFRSLKEAGDMLGVSTAIISDYIDSGSELKGWTFDVL
ncbi:MAG: hypothetical protein ACI4NM_01780 [Bullifex sp.]